MDFKDRIPRIYHSEYSGEPFTACLVCERPLQDLDAYMVEKIIRNGEAVLEMALCDACSESMIREYSQESLERELRMVERWMADAEPRAELCLGCCRARDHAGGFLLAAEFVHGYVPVYEVAICETCAESLAKQRSLKTRENFGRFIETYFPGVPHYVDLPVVLS
jgi:hypothetical protein